MQNRNRLFVKVSTIVTLFLLTSLGRVQAQVAGTITTINDTKKIFNASGNLSTTDGANAATPTTPATPATPANDGLDGPVFNVRGALPRKWEFKIKHKTNAGGGNPHWVAGGAMGVQVCIEGRHIDGPHPPPAGKIDRDPNTLPLKCGKAKRLGFGVVASSKRTAYKKVLHPLTGGGNHFDHYGVVAVTSALQAATGNQITGIYEVAARHTLKKRKPKAMRQYALGSSSGAGTTVAYDHNSRRLRFSIGAIDILDSLGGQSGVIDKLYTEDPIVAGKLTVSELTFIEQLDDGRFKFGDGEVAITDPTEKFGFNGSFSEYLIDETVGGPTVTSFALLESLTINDVAEEAAGASHFLDDFVRVNILGKGIPEAQWLRIQGFDLTFLTATDLVAETNNFTQSAELPATVLIALVEDEEPTRTPWGLIAIGLSVIIVILILILRRTMGRSRS